MHYKLLICQLKCYGPQFSVFKAQEESGSPPLKTMFFLQKADDSIYWRLLISSSFPLDFARYS